MSIETSEALTPIEAGWIAVMRNVLPADLNGLCLAPDDWYRGMGMPSSGGRCLAWFDLVADECVVLTVGAYFDGTRTVVGRLHSQFLTLDPHGRRIPRRPDHGAGGQGLRVVHEEPAATGGAARLVLHRP